MWWLVHQPLQADNHSKESMLHDMCAPFTREPMEETFPKGNNHVLNFWLIKKDTSRYIASVLLSFSLCLCFSPPLSLLLSHPVLLPLSVPVSFSPFFSFPSLSLPRFVTLALPWLFLKECQNFSSYIFFFFSFQLPLPVLRDALGTALWWLSLRPTSFYRSCYL